MDGSDKSVSSSSASPNKPPQIPKSTNENDQNYQEMGLTMLNTKKPTTTTEHFMSPTISAASKAYPPRKKILAERNESLDTHLQKTPTFDSKTSASNEFGENGENALVDDLTSSPYDPITNYLSPRPKFLRYKPNRRREIFPNRENEVREGKDDGLSISGSGSLESKKGIDGEVDLGGSGGSQESDVKQEGEETDESEEEFEEIEMERGWGLRGVLKFLLLLVVLVLSTSYISSMNSPTPSPVVQAVMGLKDRYHIFQDHVYGFVKSLESRKYVLVEREMGYVDLPANDKEEIIEVENSDDLDEVEVVQAGDGEVVDEEKGTVVEFAAGGGRESMETVEHEEKGAIEELEDVLEPQAGESANASDLEVGNNDDMDETVKIQMGEGEAVDEEKGTANEFAEGGESETMDTVEHEEKEAVAELIDVVELQARESTDVSDLEIVKTVDFSNQLAVNYELRGSKAVEIPETQFVEDKVDYQDTVSVVSGVPDASEKENEVANVPVKEDMVHNEMGRIGNVTDDYADYEIAINEAERSPEKGIIDHMETESILKAVIQVSTVYLIIASLIFAFHFNRKRNARKNTSPVVKPCVESVMSKKCSSVLASEEDKHTERLASDANSKSFINSMGEDTEEMNQSRAPSVEFLGELVVGEMSSSLRNCGMKSRMIESEVSSHSVSTEKKMGNKAQSVLVHVQPAFSEISTMNSSSYGGFTTEKKIVKKEERGDGEARKVVTTPVRRSSRIRNRAIVSP